uniref:HNH endonuclease n=1 Tax=Dendroctonus ponderosae TaxID=77166 RepID=A0AAR5NYD3_DENPD
MFIENVCQMDIIVSDFQPQSTEHTQGGYTQRGYFMPQSQNVFNQKSETEERDDLNVFSSERRNACVKALKRAPLREIYIRNDRICSYCGHFITGKPAALEDKTNPDVLLNENLGNICSL